MTPTQLKHWFADQKKQADCQIGHVRSSLNRATAGQLRPLRKINQTAFAKLSGIDRSALNKLEHGKRNWTKQLVAKYAAGIKKQGRAGK